MIWRAFVLGGLATAIAAGGFLAYLDHERDACDARGGMLVQGVGGFVCVAPAAPAPDRPGTASPGSGDTVGLYGAVSGFAKARTGRTSITVQPLPGLAAELDAVLDAWNTAAGWQLFIEDPASTVWDVSFVDLADEPTCAGYLACTGWDQFPTGWYRGCRIAIPGGAGAGGDDDPPPPPTSTLEHELGHCLGFQDVATTTDTGYRGIMSYARDRSTLVLGADDLDSLTKAGYR